MNKMSVTIACLFLVAGSCLAADAPAWAPRTGVALDRISTLQDLQALPASSLPGLFDQAVVPGVDEFRGRTFQGRILHVNYAGVGRLVYSCYTGGWFKALLGRPDPAGLSFTKIFYPERQPSGASGINYWPLLRRQSMPMQIYVSPSLEGKGDSLKVDYNLSINEVCTERPLVD